MRIINDTNLKISVILNRTVFKRLEMHSQSHSNHQQTLDISTVRVTLTPLNCASIINEILKGLLYYKCQIPYPYTWLKTIVDKRRKKEEQSPDTRRQTNYTLINHYRTVSKTYDVLEDAMGGIIKEFSSKGQVNEVVVVFGVTPQSPREVLSINVALAKRHYDRNHVSELHKYQLAILRSIFLSDKWTDHIDNSVCCTNIHIFLKKRPCTDEENSTSGFVMVKPLTLLPSVKHFRINLVSELDEDCCDMVYQDQVDQDQSDEIAWFKYKEHVKGFKDCFIGKVPACELW